VALFVEGGSRTSGSDTTVGATTRCPHADIIQFATSSLGDVSVEFSRGADTSTGGGTEGDTFSMCKSSTALTVNLGFSTSGDAVDDGGGVPTELFTGKLVSGIGLVGAATNTSHGAGRGTFRDVTSGKRTHLTQLAATGTGSGGPDSLAVQFTAGAFGVVVGEFGT